MFMIRVNVCCVSSSHQMRNGVYTLFISNYNVLPQFFLQHGFRVLLIFTKA